MRITGGEWRSRNLRAPRGTATRPTSDRVREALFSILAAGGLLDGAPRVLDLYAGSGALAFEALSRGAASAVVVEQAREALAAIHENARALGAGDRLRVVSTRVDRALTTSSPGALEGPFDLIFADPPYADVRTAPFAAVLDAAARKLARGGAFVLEHASTDDAPTIPSLAYDRSRRYGDTTISLYRSPEA
jgi:16S rRNA (guanine966-N2)-methyltransferase